MSDRIAVFNARPDRAGRDRRARSTSGRRRAFVAGFVGTSNVLAGAAALRAARPRRPVHGAARADPPSCPRGAGARDGDVARRHRRARSSTPARSPGCVVDLDAGGELVAAAERRRPPTRRRVRGDRVRLAWRRPTHAYRVRRRRRRARTSAAARRPARTDQGGPHAAPSRLRRGRSAATALPLAACGSCSVAPSAAGGSGGSTAAARAPADCRWRQSLGAGEGELDIIAWPGYAEDGSNDQDRRLGEAVREADRLQGQREGRRHLGRDGQPDEDRPVRRRVGSGDATLRLIYAGDVAPVNTTLVPNYDDLVPFLKDRPWNSVNGVRCTASRTAGAPTC